ncbi:MAG: CpsD/CapB family tyrosine-protein kinase [Planctomycetota bacterium]
MSDIHNSRMEAVFAPAQGTIDHLWSSLVRKGEFDDTKRILFTSCFHDEGTTTVASCAAIGLARHLFKQVMLVETNFFQPALAEYMGLPHEPGFSDLIRGEATLEEAFRPSGVPGLRLVPAGSGEAKGFLGSSRLQVILHRLANECEHLVIDAPPLLTSPEARLLLPFVDEVILVTRARRTTHQDIQRAVRIIDASGTTFLGAVLNHYRREAPTWLVPEG